nr:fused MFS/spermidine synthase [Chloroflexota bacterium]
MNLLAPYLFATGFWELQWGLVACGVLLVIVMQTDHAPARAKPPSRAQRRRADKSQRAGSPRRWSLRSVVAVTSLLIVVLVGLIVLIMRAISSDALLAMRSFYGVSRVWEINAEHPELHAYQLTHGKTVHGFQFENEDLRDRPTTFHAESSGIGLAISNHPTRPGNLRIGALGLGIGVITSYGQPGDIFRFYEINPDVIRIAQGKGGYFSFLADSQAHIDIIPGDARVSLERELVDGGSQNFDLLVLDAFSGDAVPLHLLTKEAFVTYLKHLKQDGIMAIHVSNRYFNLHWAVYRMADELEHRFDRGQR